MAGNTYTIDLNLTESTKTKQALASMRQSLKDNADSLDRFTDTYTRLRGEVEDVTALEKEYAKSINAAIAAKDREIDKTAKALAAIRDQSSEEAEQARNRLRQLDEERRQIMQIADAEKERRKVEAERRKLEAEREAKHQKAVEREAALKKKLARFFDPRETVNGIKANIKGLQDLARNLKTVEGRMEALDKVKERLSKVSASVSKAGAMGGKIVGGMIGGVAGIGTAMAGAAMAGAAGTSQKESALKALKGATEDDANKVFIATGADYSTIVNAINKLSNKFHGDDLIAAAIQEVKTPGIASVLMASNSAIDTSKLEATLDQIRKSSGNADLSSAIAASTKARSVTTGAVSQTDYMNAYAALQTAGIDEESIDRIIASVAKQGGDFTENFNKTDLSKYVRGQQKNMIEGVKLTAIDKNRTAEASPAERLQETMNRISLVKDQLLMKIMPKIADVVEQIIDSPAFTAMVDGFAKFIKDFLPVFSQVVNALLPVAERLLPPILRAMEPVVRSISPILNRLTPFLEMAVNTLEPVLETIAQAVDWILSGQAIKDIKETLSDALEAVIAGINKAIAFITSPVISGINAMIDLINGLPFTDGDIQHINVPQLANGGVATVPSLCGEHGAELVLPMNNPSRAQSLVNNYTTTQNFTMMGNQTPLSLAQSIASDRFIRHAVKW